ETAGEQHGHLIAGDGVPHTNLRLCRIIASDTENDRAGDANVAAMNMRCRKVYDIGDPWRHRQRCLIVVECEHDHPGGHWITDRCGNLLVNSCDSHAQLISDGDVDEAQRYHTYQKRQ